MNSYISINSKILEKLLKGYNLTIIGMQEIVKVAQKRSKTYSGFNRAARKLQFKD